MKGRRSKVREINGLVVDEGGRLEDATPANDGIVRITLEIKGGAEEPGQHLLPRLLKSTNGVVSRTASEIAARGKAGNNE